MVIDALVVKKQHRAQALSLLCTFVRHQPPHLYEALKTDLMDHLLQCLMIDTSTTVVSLALTTLIMFLPHVPSSLVHYLPRLFAVYARIMCWEKADPERLNDETSAESGEESPVHSPIAEPAMFVDPTWDILPRSSDTADSMAPDLTHLFTFLYGLYPLNFMNFIRKPSKYLRDAKHPGAEGLKLDTNAIHHRSEQFRRVHLLHPHFYTMTVEAELADTNRFLESEPADVVAQCMGLCAAVPAVLNDPGPPPTGKLPGIPQSARTATEDIPAQSLAEDGANGSSEPASPTSRLHSWRDTQSTTVSFSAQESMKMMRKSSQHSRSRRSSRATSRRSSPNRTPHGSYPHDSPTLPAHIIHSASDTKLKDMLQAQESLRTNLRNDSNASLSTQEAPRLDAYIQSLAQAPNARSPALRPTANGGSSNTAFLQREILLLKNDLNFERYLKQQHLSHIGQLQHKYIREATVEAETQKLINNNKTLKLKQEEAKKTLATLRKETTASKNHAKKWEAELNAKAKSLREDQRKWKADEESLRRELQEARQEGDQLKSLVVETEAKELLSRQKLQSVEANLGELEKLRAEVEILNKRLKDFEAREEQFEFGRQNEEIARTQLETLRLKFKARNGEVEKMKVAYDERLAELADRLEQAQQSPAHSPQAFQAMLDSALASGHARFVQLKRLYNHLLSRYADLEMKYMELQTQVERPEGESYDGSGDSSGPMHSIGQDLSLGQMGDEFDFFGGRRGGGDDGMEPRSRKASATSTHDGWGTTSYNGGTSTHPINVKFPNPPARLESLEDYGQMDGMMSGGNGGINAGGYGSMSGHTSYHGANTRDRMTPFEHSLAPLRSRGRDSDGSSEHSANTKAKIKASSQVRVYGRGGFATILLLMTAC